ncbi:MAG: cupin domain-containing protein [Leptospiraceae bacterium]|nr:cupin domain-containing protein [Leptospiraceae bacterium]
MHPKLPLTGYSLVGCTVAPGFEFSDFELATEELLQNFSEHKNTLKNWIKPS